MRCKPTIQTSCWCDGGFEMMNRERSKEGTLTSARHWNNNVNSYLLIHHAATVRSLSSLELRSHNCRRKLLSFGMASSLIPCGEERWRHCRVLWTPTQTAAAVNCVVCVCKKVIITWCTVAKGRSWACSRQLSRPLSGVCKLLSVCSLSSSDRAGPCEMSTDAARQWLHLAWWCFIPNISQLVIATQGLYYIVSTTSSSSSSSSSSHCTQGPVLLLRLDGISSDCMEGHSTLYSIKQVHFFF